MRIATLTAARTSLVAFLILGAMMSLMSSWSLLDFEFAEELWLCEIIIKTNIIPNTAFKISSIPSSKEMKSNRQVLNIKFRKITIWRIFVDWTQGWCPSGREKIDLIIEFKVNLKIKFNLLLICFC